MPFQRAVGVGFERDRQPQRVPKKKKKRRGAAKVPKTFCQGYSCLYSDSQSKCEETLHDSDVSWNVV